jgi:hypothetical protein
MSEQPAEKRPKQKQRWRDMSSARRRLIVAAGSVQVALAITAWIDLARRDRALVNGPKPMWGAIIALNTVGPLSYFRWGRRRSAPETT